MDFLQVNIQHLFRIIRSTVHGESKKIKTPFLHFIPFSRVNAKVLLLSIVVSSSLLQVFFIVSELEGCQFLQTVLQNRFLTHVSLTIGIIMAGMEVAVSLRDTGREYSSVAFSELYHSLRLSFSLHFPCSSAVIECRMAFAAWFKDIVVFCYL